VVGDQPAASPHFRGEEVGPRLKVVPWCYKRTADVAEAATAKKWTLPIHNWSEALNQFAVEFGDRMPKLD
jgi:hypothetical protein